MSWKCTKQSQGVKCSHINANRKQICDKCGKKRTVKKSTKQSTMVGNHFGRLAVVEPGSGKVRTSWICQCACGNTVEVLQQSLLAGLTKSCGCLQKERTAISATKILTGKFGDWTVLKPSERRGKNGGMYYLCICKCGEESEISSSSLIQGQSTGCKNCASEGLKRDHCVNGHDTIIWGRNDSGACKACVKERNLKREYGISLDEYVQLWEFQERSCAICGEALDISLGVPGWSQGSRTECDHDHTKGLSKRESVRGLLCGGRWSGCNRKLGHVDDAEWLAAASLYIADPPAQRMLR